MKQARRIFLLCAAVLCGCSTLEVAERSGADSSFIMAYFKPPRGMTLNGVGIATFEQGGVGRFLSVHYTESGLAYVENVTPGKYYIREVDLKWLEDGEVRTFYFGSPWSMGGFEERSFTVGADEIAFIGAFKFSGVGLGVFSLGSSDVRPYAEMVKKDCIKEVLKNIKNQSWRARLTEELVKEETPSQEEKPSEGEGTSVQPASPAGQTGESTKETVPVQVELKIGS